MTKVSELLGDLSGLPVLSYIQDPRMTDWHWFFIGAACLVLSRLILRVSFSALAVASLTVAAISAVWSLTLVQQASIAIVVVPLVFVYLLWRGQVFMPANATARIRRRKSHLIGLRASVLQRAATGRGKIQLNDAVWTVLSSEDFKRGDLVEVAGYTGNMLEVRPVREGE